MRDQVLQEVSVLKRREHRGRLQVWMQGGALERAKFAVGARYNVSATAQSVVLELDPEGRRKVSRKPRASNNGLTPVIDLHSNHDLEPVAGCELVRVLFEQGRIEITPLANERRRQERLARLRAKFDAGQELSTAAIAGGGGMTGLAAHRGLVAAGLDVRLAAHNEMRADLVDHARWVNPIFDERTQLLTAPLQELAFDDEAMARVGKVEVLELGLPCSAASVAGRAKTRMDFPEAHPEIGHLVVGALALVAKFNPVVAVFENVVPYASTASAALMRHQLRDFGYDVHEATLQATDFGALESRKRWFLVAMTRGVEFDLAGLRPKPFRVRTLAEVLEPADSEALTWSPMEGLKDKQERDALRGNGFKMQVFTGDETSVSCLTKGLQKNRSTDPKIRHPQFPDLLRVPTPAEHARIKGFEPTLVEGLSKTVAHQMLGQGVVAEPVAALFEHIADALIRWYASSQSDRAAANDTMVQSSALLKAVG